MFYEIRHYRTRAGRRDEWVRYMDDVVIPFMISKGMTVTGSFIDNETDDGYLWIRRFADETERLALYVNVYESTTWTDEIGPFIRSILRIQDSIVTRVTPTAGTLLHFPLHHESHPPE